MKKKKKKNRKKEAEENEEEKEKKKQEAEEKRKEEEKKKKEAEEKRKEEAKVHQSLYKAILSQSIGTVDRILRNGKVKVTDKITISGNTALHVAAGTTKNQEFLQHMLNFGAHDNPQLDMRNSEGSRLLHVAAIVGNTEIAKILVEKNNDLLFTTDKEGHTPLARAHSNMHTDTYLYLLNPTNTQDIEMGALFASTSGDELIVNAIYSKDYSKYKLPEHLINKLHMDADHLSFILDHLQIQQGH